MSVYLDVTLKAARDKRDEVRRLLTEGIDTSERRKIQKAALHERASSSYEVVACEWFSKFSQNWAARHSSKIIRRLEPEVFAWLGGRPFADLTEPELLRTIKRIESRGAPVITRSDAMTNISKREQCPQSEFENEFHRLLGRLVHANAQFDFNVGLQLNCFGIYYQADVKELLDPRKTQLKQRLIAFKRIVLKAYAPAGEAALAEFVEWFGRANKARALRNDYVHGRWGVPGKYAGGDDCPLVDAQPLLTFLQLNWDMSPGQPDRSISMTLAEFAQQVETVEYLFANYWKLSKKYARFARLGTEGLG